MAGSVIGSYAEPVSAAIWFCLNHYDYNNAEFLAEILHVEVGSEKTLHLLCTCYYRQGNIKRAAHLLSSHSLTDPESKYLLARCLFEQEKYSLAEQELVRNGSRKDIDQIIDSLVDEYGQLSGHVLGLLAQCCRRTERIDKAACYLKASLKQNSFLWESFAALCQMGVPVNPQNFFKSETCPLIREPKLTFAGMKSLNELISTGGIGTVMSADENVDPMLLSSARQPTMDTPLTTSGMLSQSDLLRLSFSTTGDMSMSNFAAPHTMSVKKTRQKWESPSPPLFGVVPVALFVTPPAVMSSNTPCTTPSDVTSGDVPCTTPPAVTSSSTRRICYTTPKTKTQLMAPPPVPSKQQSVRRTVPRTLSPPSLSSNLSPGQFSISKVQTRSASRGGPTKPFNLSTSPRRSARLSGQVSFNTTKSQGRQISTRSMTSQSKVKLKAADRLQSPLILSPTSSTPLTSRRQHHDFSVINPRSPSTQSDTSSLPESSSSIMSGITKLPTTPGDMQGVLDTQTHTNVVNHDALVATLQQGLDSLMSLLCAIGSAYLALFVYDCKQALKLFDKLPSHQYNTSWVLRHVARAYFESAKYMRAADVFQEIRSNDPHLHEDMDIFSSVLWHTQDEIQLSKLAHDLTDSNKKSPQAWCAVGNCFSLQKDHQSAIKFFERACQLDKMFVYGHTLLGHEYLALDNFVEALSCFRSAMSVDPRHYNAWYGMGMVFYKQEKYRLAEVHFSRALAINSSNAVLCCHIGIVQQARKCHDQALRSLNKAVEMDPNNSLCRFRRASAFICLKRYQEALDDLTELEHMVPKESGIYFLKGQIYKKLGHTHLSLMNLSWAMQLDPRGNSHSQLKELFEQQYGDQMHVLEDASDDDAPRLEDNVDMEGSLL